MASANTRKFAHGGRISACSSYVYKRGVRVALFSRISNWGVGSLWREHNLIRGQRALKVREWAHKHAFSLIFLSVMFVITWIVEVISNVLF